MVGLTFRARIDTLTDNALRRGRGEVWNGGSVSEYMLCLGSSHVRKLRRSFGEMLRRLSTFKFQGKWSRAVPCSVDFGREAPKFRSEICCGFLGGLFPPFLSKEKAPPKSTPKSPAKFTQEFVRINSPRISAEAFYWEMDTNERERDIQRRPFVHNSVCSQFSEGCLQLWRSVRNSVWDPFNRN